MGVQQHAAVRQAVLDVMADTGITPDAPDSWTADLPTFGAVQAKLQTYASNPTNAQARFAASAASHISTVFVWWGWPGLAQCPRRRSFKVEAPAEASVNSSPNL